MRKLGDGIWFGSMILGIGKMASDFKTHVEELINNLRRGQYLEGWMGMFIWYGCWRRYNQPLSIHLSTHIEIRPTLYRKSLLNQSYSASARTSNQHLEKKNQIQVMMFV